MAGKVTGGRNALTLDDLQQVAQVLKSNGTDGELVMGFREIAPEDINLNEPVFIIFDGLPVPFFIESFTKRGNSKALVRLTGIGSLEDVDEIAGKAVYIEEDSMPELSLEEDGYAALVGWMVLTPEIPDQVGDDRDTVVGDDEETVIGDDEKTVGDDRDTVVEDDEEMVIGDDMDTVVGYDEETVIEDDRAVAEPSLPALTGNLIEVGTITDFMDIPNNPCIEVETENGAVILPLHEDFILSVDPEYQEIIMQIPAGLI